MSEKYKFLNPEGIFFVTATIIDWIDLFTRKDYVEIVLDSLKYCQNKKDLIIHAWCLMPSHLLAIISRGGIHELADIMRDFKRFTSKEIINCISQINESRSKWLLPHFHIAGDKLKRIHNHKVWRDGNHPIELSTNEMVDQRLHYTHYNPVEAGYVFEPEHYALSSAIDYCGGKGLLNVVLLD